MVRHCDIFVLLNNYVTLGLQKHVFLIKWDIRHFFVRCYVWKLRHNYVGSWFVNLLYLFLHQNYVINAFLTMHIFHDIRITFFCGTFALRMEITLKLRFIFVRHCDVFLLRHNYVIYLFDVLTFFKTLEWPYILVRSNTYGNGVIITFRFCSSLWRAFYCVTITLFVCSM